MGKFKFKGCLIEVDHFITGSGAAGALIANVLSACGCEQQSVLLVEAGSANINDPILNLLEFNRIILSNLWNKYGWPGQSYNEIDLANRNFLVPQTGLTLGGSTRINNANAVKASVANLTNWEALLGKFWSPHRFYEAYKKLEHFHKAAGSGPIPGRGHHGPISVTQIPPTGALQVGLDTANAANQALGVPIVASYNDKATPIGACPNWEVFAEPSGVRSDSLTAFLGPEVIQPYKGVAEAFRGVGERRKHLLVLTRARFQRVLFEGKKAVGALFIRDGISYEVRARTAVWIENGFLSPQALMVSGVGPRGDLADAGIPLVYDNPNVGKHMTNHTAISFTMPKSPLKPATDPNNPNFTVAAGLFTADPTGLTNQAQRAVQIIYQDGLVTGTNTPNPAVLVSTLFQLHPWSEGTLTVDSTDIQKIPLVDYDYLRDQRDVDFYVQAFKKVVSPLVKRLNAIDPTYNIAAMNPSLAVIDNPDTTALVAFIKANIRQTHHARGSNLMAPENQGGVVDKRGRVHGVERLMCVDTSTLTYQPDGNNCFTVWAAALLVAEWARKRGSVDRT